MNYDFNIKINVDDDGVFGFKTEQEVKEFVLDELSKLACVNSVEVDTRRYDLQKLADIIVDNLGLSEKKRNKIEKILKEYL